ncbi:hypothetical protein ABIB40_000683 [Pedobacter sp. UYP30]|uniref:hypothetical protein n=1 Tax=Pedobacter sp. UYP30 TaxID=1756400 RepID=UPI003395AF49
MNDFLITSLKNDSTILLPCRENDLFIWVRDSGGLLSKTANYGIMDLCVMSAGSSIAITNRVEDLPNYLYVSSDQISGYKNVNVILKKHKKVYRKSLNQIEIDEISAFWKIQTGDYIIWAGDSRAEICSINGVLKIFGFDTGYLLINESEFNSDFGQEDATSTNDGLSTERASLLNEALKFLSRKGKSRTSANSWSLG